MEDYPQIKKIYEDIKNLNIQGATNVAISTFEGMKIYIELSREESKEKFLSTLFEIGKQLAYARDNEPLARNGVTYLKHFFGQQFSVLPEISVMKREFTTLCDKYLALIEGTKQKILDNNSKNLLNYDKVLTHCHSSTAVSLIKAIGKGDKDFEVVCTETRPRFQGRKTALSLLEAKIKTTLITDSAAESFVIGRGSVPIDVVFIGCDQITSKGHAINKIGSWGISMAAYYAGKPVYVVTPLLKIDSNSFLESVKIEVRESREIWDDAPKDLHIFNPAFEIVDNVLITGYLTEFGLIHPTNVENIVKEQYPWILDN
ncbi:MAG TPA: translation initiation factor eIF-2B [Candidatus Dojkabacteria bacterium]|nr:translation initiation factor eIF-2B [Candidatus Dojkabacteria bacterium]